MMNERQAVAGQPATGAVSRDPVTQAQLREPVEPVLAGRDPLAMDETVGAHDGSDQAGAAGWSTSQAVGDDVERDISEGRSSSGDDLRARGDGPAAGGADDAAADDADSASDDADDACDDPPRSDGAVGVSAAVDDDAVALLDLPRWTEHLHAPRLARR